METADVVVRRIFTRVVARAGSPSGIVVSLAAAVVATAADRAGVPKPKSPALPAVVPHRAARL